MYSIYALMYIHIKIIHTYKNIKYNIVKTVLSQGSATYAPLAELGPKNLWTWSFRGIWL